ncbi:MAG TPA: peptide-methionine (R)-S-oxide reductase MsrB [Acidimicrobiia bacterium]|nr:peptide-methionine (R)-S-oxide reductase MsrB [Acidimicrobiia bacterium]
MTDMKKPIEEMTDDDWREQLTEEQFRVLREQGTEPAFSGIYWDNHDDGVYRCAGCNTPLFESSSKFESGSGWPSFDKPVADDVIEEVTDTSHGMKRSEIRCAKCGGHVGHVFPDGPRATTGLRYCTNSASLQFEEKE